MRHYLTADNASDKLLEFASERFPGVFGFASSVEGGRIPTPSSRFVATADLVGLSDRYKGEPLGVQGRRSAGASAAEVPDCDSEPNRRSAFSLTSFCPIWLATVA